MNKRRIFSVWIGFILLVFAFMLSACAQPDGEPLVTSSRTPAASVPQTTTEASPTSSTSPTPTPRPYRLQPGDLLLAASEDDIPALDVEDADFVPAEAGNREWDVDELVVGLELDGHARAYPVRLLSLHEVINDELAGVPVAVTWCPLCYSAIVFDRRVEGTTLTFAVSGYLLESNLVMFDRQTGTLWSQLLGQGIRGAHRGEWLKMYPSQVTSWMAWQERHPETEVLSAAALGRDAEKLIDPYVGYYSSGVSGLSAGGVSDDRLEDKALVVGLEASGEAAAYPLRELKELGWIQSEVGNVPVLMVYDSDLEAPFVYSRELAEQVLDFELAGEPGILADQQTQSRWRLKEGFAISGPLEGEELDRMQARVTFWFSWVGLHPGTKLYEAND
ncbi:MAG: DUF3179 domain-containing protein [Anaerolineales bacterium]